MKKRLVIIVIALALIIAAVLLLRPANDKVYSYTIKEEDDTLIQHLGIRCDSKDNIQYIFTYMTYNEDIVKDEQWIIDRTNKALDIKDSYDGTYDFNLELKNIPYYRVLAYDYCSIDFRKDFNVNEHLDLLEYLGLAKYINGNKIKVNQETLLSDEAFPYQYVMLNGEKNIEEVTDNGGGLMFGFGNKKSYKVDYCGQMYFYEGAKESYKEGSKVTLKYDLIATDTDYYFYLDGQPLIYEYENEAIVISFVMPNHDVKLEVQTVNSMEAFIKTSIDIKVTNQVVRGDIWFLADNKSNRKTTLWGPATIAKEQYDAGETVSFTINEEESYIINMIDEDGLYYSVGGVKIKEGQEVVIRDEIGMSAFVDIYADGELVKEYEMFVAKL